MKINYTKELNFNKFFNSSYIDNGYIFFTYMNKCISYKSLNLKKCEYENINPDNIFAG